MGDGMVHGKVPALCAGQRKEACVAGVAGSSAVRERVRVMEGCGAAWGLDSGLRA